MLNSVEVQPLSAQVERFVQALEMAGSPLSKERLAALKLVLDTKDTKLRRSDWIMAQYRS